MNAIIQHTIPGWDGKTDPANHLRRQARQAVIDDLTDLVAYDRAQRSIAKLEDLQPGLTKQHDGLMAEYKAAVADREAAEDKLARLQSQKGEAKTAPDRQRLTAEIKDVTEQLEPLSRRPRPLLAKANEVGRDISDIAGLITRLRSISRPTGPVIDLLTPADFG